MLAEILLVFGFVAIPLAIAISFLLLVLGEVLGIDKHDIERYLEKRKEKKTNRK